MLATWRLTQVWTISEGWGSLQVWDILDQPEAETASDAGSHCISHCTAEVAAGVFARLDPATVKQVVLIGWGTTEAATMFDSRSLWPMICLEACNQFAMG